MEKEKEPVTQTEEKTEAPVTRTDEKNEKKEDVKTFTQDEVNAMILKAEAKANKKFEGIDLKKYKEWEESQKTEADRQAEKEKEYQAKDEKISRLEKEKLLYKNGVQDEEDQDYIIYKVSKMEGDFGENLIQFLDDNPKYSEAQKMEVTKTVDLGDEHKSTDTPDLQNMSYEEYKNYRNKK